MTNTNTKIFITNLGKYNEGELIGEWVTLTATDEEFEAVYNRIGINEQYEEWFITDYNTDINGLEIGEYDSIDDLNELAETLEELDETEKEVVEAMLEEGFDINETIFYKGIMPSEKVLDLPVDCNTLTGSVNL